MIPFSPDITVREVDINDAGALAHLLNQATSDIDHCRANDADSVQSYILHDTQQEAGSSQQWQSRQCIGAWQAGRLIGFLDSALCSAIDDSPVVGLQAAGVLPQQTSPEAAYYGLIRAIILPNDSALAIAVKQSLLDPLEERSRDGGIESVYAFAPHTGYPYIQAGIGTLPAQWREHFRLLTESGYQLRQRYRAMKRPLHEFVEEIYPTISVSLETQNTPTGWECQLYHRRINRIGIIRATGISLDPEPTAANRPRIMTDALTPMAVINELHIDDEWRGQNLGKFLLRRAINDGRHRGYEEMLMYLRQDHHRGWSLLAQQGFQELDYRGYTFQKDLTAR